MSRTRYIKPGFFENEALSSCDPLARILFAGLWCWADKAGRLKDRPRTLKNQILGFDDCDCDALLNELVAGGFILRYVVEGERYIQISAFESHQRPHTHEPESKIPGPDAGTPLNVPTASFNARAESRHVTAPPEHVTAPPEHVTAPPALNGNSNYNGNSNTSTTREGAGAADSSDAVDEVERVFQILNDGFKIEQPKSARKSIREAIAQCPDVDPIITALETVEWQRDEHDKRLAGRPNKFRRIVLAWVGSMHHNQKERQRLRTPGKTPIVVAPVDPAIAARTDQMYERLARKRQRRELVDTPAEYDPESLGAILHFREKSAG